MLEFDEDLQRIVGLHWKSVLAVRKSVFGDDPSPADVQHVPKDNAEVCYRLRSSIHDAIRKICLLPGSVSLEIAFYCDNRSGSCCCQHIDNWAFH